jgi:hypothetical protein
LFGRTRAPICATNDRPNYKRTMLLKWNPTRDINSVTASETLRSDGKAHLKALAHVSPNLLKQTQLLELHYGGREGDAL